MSKLFDNYLNLKATEKDANNTLYIFKSGIFFIFLDNDARIASKLLNLKLTYLTENIIKCGFPINSLEKYTNILNKTSYKIKIIDTAKNYIYTFDDYKLDKKIEELLSVINSVDKNSLSVKEAYDFIDFLKEYTQNIFGKENNNAY